MRMHDTPALSLLQPPPKAAVQIFEAQGALSERALLIKRASQRIPKTAEDLPVGFYRADLLAIPQHHEVVLDSGTAPEDVEAAELARQQTQEAQALHTAYIELQYDNGYPTLPSGEPFWHKLDYEPGLAFSAFQMYLELNEQGARELSALANDEEFKRVYTQAHLSQVTPSGQISQHDILLALTEYSIVYYWRARAKAHDLFKEAAYRHIRIQRGMVAEDYHYKMAEKLLTRLSTRLEEEDFIKNMKPRDVIDAVKAAVAIQRVSVGLPAGGPLPGKESPEATQFEAILRTIGAQRGAQQGDPGQQSRQGNEAVRRIMEDPGTVQSMQEMIIKITKVSMNKKAPVERPGRTYTVDGAPIDDSDDGLADDISFHKGI